MVRLRPVRTSDVALLDAAANDPARAGEHAWFGYRSSRLGDRVARDETITEQGGSLAIEDGQDELAGIVSWYVRENGPPPNGRCWMIGILVLPEHRGRGSGAGAQAEVVRYLFQHTPAVRVEASTERGNTAERKALERAGFTQEGTLRQAVFREGEWRDMVLYSILRTEVTDATPD